MQAKHKKCGFRDKVKVCAFKPEDCKPEECDFFDIEFAPKPIKKVFKKERAEVIKLTNEMKMMKKKGEHKENPEKYKELKKLRNDKAVGIIKLSKAYMYVKRAKV